MSDDELRDERPANAADDDGKTFTVTMLTPLRRRFEWWLNNNGFEMVHVPDTLPDVFIVVPTDARLAAYDLAESPDSSDG